MDALRPRTFLSVGFNSYGAGNGFAPPHCSAIHREFLQMLKVILQRNQTFKREKTEWD